MKLTSEQQAWIEHDLKMMAGHIKRMEKANINTPNIDFERQLVKRYRKALGNTPQKH